MDSLTQIVLGASVGHAVFSGEAGKHIGRKALLAGAICGTLPDLDVLVPFADDVADFTYHRSFSHSFIILTLITPIIVWAGYALTNFFERITKKKNNGAGGLVDDRDTRAHKARWLLLVFLALNTHVLLDCFTIYGTQALWPLSNYPVGWSTIFIIDPLYTVPLIVGVSIAFLSQRKQLHNKHVTSRRAITAGLILSSLYLLFTVFMHHSVEKRGMAALDKQGVQYSKLLAAPTPMSLLWRYVALPPEMSDENPGNEKSQYLEGYYSVFDKSNTIGFTPYADGSELLSAVDNHWPVERLQWFTKGFYGVNVENKRLLISDLRMGIESQYVFRFEVARSENSEWILLPGRLLPFRPDTKRMAKLLQRVTDENVQIDSANSR